jgi:uncharacterized iron-regulated membrane protein
MGMTKASLRKLWFQVHKWLGISLAVIFIPLSLSGATLVWHDTVDSAINPQRQVSGDGTAALAPSAYVAAAKAQMESGQQVSAMRFEEGRALAITATNMQLPEESYRPLKRTIIWLDPADAQLVDKAASNSGFIRTMEELHGSLFIPMYGRPIIGVIGIAMLLSSISGLWLWWPVKGSFSKGLKWRRGNDTFTNLHHQAGFWICIPLAMLSLTGVWIAFPEIAATLSGTTAPSLAERMVRMRARPLSVTNLAVDAVLAKAQAEKPGPLAAISWPTELDPAWKVSIRTSGKPAEVAIDDATGAVKAAGGRPGRIGMILRRMHDGIDMGPVWQAMIFVAGLMPTLLGITGLVMWWRARGWRADVARRSSRSKVQT